MHDHDMPTKIQQLAIDSYDQGVADERKRCFDIATKRVEDLMQGMKSWHGYPGYSYQAMEAMIISERIDDTAFRTRWKDDGKMPEMKWFVSGGIYSDTTFKILTSEAEEYGPYDTYEAAYSEWKYHMFLNVDNALHRLTVVQRLVNA
jgi:hypothetical protein